MPFRRNEDALYSIPQRFADQQIPFCPVCGTDAPRWLTAQNQKFLFKYYYFKCAVCGSILSTTEEDVCGLSKTTRTLSGKYKKHKGKDNDKIYASVDKLGAGITDIERISLQGRELILEDLLEAGRQLAEKRKKEECPE